ncbi:putative disease resistance protein At3g14460 isoform X2 [Glycine max]|uniref:putative disease resistance protein At3g14460 isoform X2 n=1 Tax=Glycine max TaxID=3847 RepID=UPI001B35490A|nr:putative disease resistance protein At3g14460 isoform X2 [Glycine max]
MALELVGGALLSAFLQVAFEKLASPQVRDFFRGRKLDEKLLNNLEIKLNSIQALADDAELKQFRDPRVRNWLLKVKDAVFDAEDLLDEIQHEISKCQVEAEAEAESQTCTCKVPNFFKSSPVGSFNKEIKSRMEQVLEDLENLASQSGYLGLQNASGVGSGFGGAVSQQSQSTSLLVESVIYGRDDDKEMIFNWLTSDIDNCNKLSILSIVGMGGLGKTTLAQHVFNDPRIENKFDIKAWVCVSDEFDVFNVTRTILEAVTKSTDDSRNREMVQGRLREKLTGKRFFLVLDDVWNRKQKEWKDLQTPLNDGASGSKIVVTTRDKKVASIVGSNKIHSLELLQDDHCWRLFTKHAFQDDSHQPNPDFKEIGVKIVKKCKGLPLALTTIGSLLHQKSSISEWEGILKSEIWEFSEEDISIVPALALSYHHLPSHLKRCFAYCALFPKDYRFHKEGLIQLWMAENFLQCHQQSRSPEEVGEQYFNDLLSRSFFQQSSNIKGTPFVMHDLLNDLAKYVCGDICFRLEDDQVTNIPKTTRHFSVASNHVKCFDGFRTLYNAERLRTFMPSSEEMSFHNYNWWHCMMSTDELFSKFKFLRVLSLSGYSNLTEALDSVGNLKYLHSLDLSNTDIKKLPESTCSLYNLQILKLNGCRHLKELPSNLHKLTDLHRLELINTGVRKVPAHLGKLKYLQVLMSSFNVGKSREFSIQQLGELNLHGSLSIRQLQNVENPSDALAVDLKNKTHLVEVELEWDSDRNPDDSTKERDEIVIENLQPSKHLEKLRMRNYGGTQFPSWLSDNSSCNVVSLTLDNCQSCQRLPPLGLLPFLKELSIGGLDGIVSINDDFFGSSSSSFTSLESLKFFDMKEWEEWECKGVTGAFPRLQRLSILHCPKLKGHLPEQLCHLNDLKISGCEQLVPSALSAPDIHELVGGSLLSAFLQVAFEKLASLQVRGFFRGRKLDEKLLNNLEIKLNSIQALADDAELKQFRDPLVRNWLLKVKDAVFDAEDILDEIQHEISKCQVEVEAEAESQTCTCNVPNFFKSSPASSFNREIKSRIEQVLENLENLARQSGYLGLKNASGVGSGFGGAVSQQSQSTSLLVESVIYGRDDDKEMIVNWLTSDIDNCSELSILSIVGMGGLGKTKLAQHVFNDPRIENKFDIKAWVCVSDEFDVFNVTRTILVEVTKSTDDSRNREMVQERLRLKLTGKRFFLVLDDVWNRNQEKWKDLLTPLNDGAPGSKIVVTTRDKKVASIVGSNKIHSLELLQDDHCWRLFAKHAFQDDSHQPNPDFKEIGAKIVEKCKGLPLALTTIGSLLHQKSSISEWEGILRSEIWEFSEEDSSIVPALALSYHHLPSHLKRCFAYFALFPKDYRFHKEGLIQLWMAENFLQCHQQSRSPEEVGEQYFNDLLSRSFFQQSSNIKGTPFVMHDLLNDLAKYVCGDICFRLEDDQVTNIPKTTRHFSVASNYVKCFDGFRTLYNAERLRTFMSSSEEMSFHYYNRWQCKMSTDELFSKFKFLRVLSLSGYSNLTEAPDSVGNLKYLHSLDLSNTDIEKLPESTCSLYNLLILKLNGCKHLKELPSNLHKLTNLHSLELINTGVRKVPAHLGKLKYLQVSMSPFKVGKSREFSIQQLGELNLHGSLSIQNLQNVENPSDALAVDLKNKTHLVEVELRWDFFWNPDDSTKERDEIVIENLQPSKHLEKLTMRHYGGKQFPRWLFNNSLLNVVSLTLENCQSCQRLPPLGLLPFLKELSIEGLDGIVSINADFFGSSSCSFTSLESLKFFDMEEWEEWEYKGVTGAFPRLQRLYIEDCPKLKGHLPEQLCHLNDLKISGCEQLVPSALSAPDIHKLYLRDCGKLQIDHGFTLKELTITGHTVEAALLEQIGRNYSCSNNNIPMHSCYDFLLRLEISSGCDSLMTIQLDIFPMLRRLDIRKCPNLQRISQGQAHNHLQCLRIVECPQLESLPEGMHVLLPSLNYLYIGDCPKVQMFPEGGVPSNLKRMGLYGSSKLISLKSALGGNHSLESLEIGKVDLESLLDEGVLPHSLVTLWIRECGDLKRLDYKGLCHLSSLETLILYDCPRLECLPEEGLPKSISTLHIDNCPLLQQRCREPEGEDWPKIAHIEHVYCK